MKVVLFLALAASLACSEDPLATAMDNRLGHTAGLPSVMNGNEGTIYPSAQEQSAEAKADGLAVSGAHQDVFGLTQPPGEGVELLPEWASSNAVLIAWHEPLASYFESLVDVLIGTTSVWILTQNDEMSESVGLRLKAMGIDDDRVQFFEYEHEAFWTRDFGPWSVRSANGEVGFVDPRYYPTRYRDDAVPTLLGERTGTSTYRPKLSAEGGNLMSNGSGLCVTTTRLNYNNPPLKSYEMHAVLNMWAGCDQTVFLEPLKGERTGHVDLIAKFTQADTVVLGSYLISDDEDKAARLERNAERLSDVRLADGRALRVLRIPMPPNGENYFPTYTNSLLVNETLVMPTFKGFPELEARAVEVYQEALPQDTSIALVDASDVIEFGGAVHCTTMQLSFGVMASMAALDDRPGPLYVPDGAYLQTVNQPIEDLGTLRVSQTIVQSGVTGIDVLELVVELEHRIPESLEIHLVRDGQRVLVGMADDISPLNQTRRIVSGFSDQPLDGLWTLEVEDTSAGFRGALLSWRLRALE